MTDILGELIAYSRENRRVCPVPEMWSRLYELLPERRRDGSGQEPPLLLILGAWWETGDDENRDSLELRLRWELSTARLEEQDAFSVHCQK